MSHLSKAFQAGKFNFSAILPAIAHTKSHLETIKAESTVLDALEKDIDGNRFIATELKISRRDADELVNIQSKYIDRLINPLNPNRTNSYEPRAYGNFAPGDS